MNEWIPEAKRILPHEIICSKYGPCEELLVRSSYQAGLIDFSLTQEEPQ